MQALDPMNLTPTEMTSSQKENHVSQLVGALSVPSSCPRVYLHPVPEP